MWDGKNKAVTFSFDDGMTQDIRLVEIFNKYNLKATFNLNSANLGLKGERIADGKKVTRNKVDACDVKSLYAGHEVAAHSLTHPSLTELDDATVIYQVETDRRILSELCGYEVIGMAYPYGTRDERVIKILKENTGIKYARTVDLADGFGLQTELLNFNPTVKFTDEKKLFETAEAFLNAPGTDKKLLYVWGHSYELDDGLISWEKFEEFCRYISGREEVFYGTNKEVFGL